MQRILCRSKIHRARVTDKSLNYEGSLTVDRDLMDAADMMPFEKVQVVNINNGLRAETYLIEGERGSGDIVVNGALARWAEKDDLLIILTYAVVDESELERFEPRIVLVDGDNRIVK
ncbi:aspartate 1-decarboxylase [candidate division KSB1 bacterium]|nr:aspartate 1-decarboxylase [candidate division KSB1 bacterium]